MATFAIYKTLWINASPSVVFNALTNSAKIIQYYPLQEVVSTWEVGSEITLKGNDGEKDFVDYGRIERLEINQQFQYCYWSDNHGTERTPDNHLTICYALHEVDNGTNLELEHKNFKSEKMYSEMLNVWDFLLLSLKTLLKRTRFKITY